MAFIPLMLDTFNFRVKAYKLIFGIRVSKYDMYSVIGISFGVFLTQLS